ncbi:DNA cytosine methyltransferase [Burkholderia sp. BCC1972]|uniref:DNA cytosine methyltransferase n=1 Tax=Burkholderia sp. BCC1972 TaxID=2817438 RepID=UPI002ABE8C49|nr:DNA cytosine methyltransferase [Burkholderia sp. BCC1972]
MSVAAVDLFCGAGGLTHGLRKAGIDVQAGYDLDPKCRWPYERNNHGALFFERDICSVSGEELGKHFGGARIRVLAGCAPCQPFSSYSLGKTDTADKRWSMLTEFGRLVRETLPDIVTMENVPQVRRHGVFEQFVRALFRARYKVSAEIVACTDYGVPQERKRLVLLASRFGEIKLRERDPRRDRRRTVRDTIGHLPVLGAGDSYAPDIVHTSSKLSERNMARIRASIPGGSWRTWDQELIADCHKEASGSSFPSVYGRMQWDKPSPTITTQFFGFGNGRFGHPAQDRAISLREGALLQTFPRNYSFVAPGEVVEIKSIGRLIGNAVPVRLGQVIGESILQHLDELGA